MQITELLKDFFSNNKNYVWGYILFSLANPIVKVIIPHYYGKIIKKLPQNDPITNDVVTVIAFWIISQLFYTMINNLDKTFVPKLQSHIRSNVIKGILETHKENYKELELGEIIGRIVKLTDAIKELFYQIRSLLIPLVLVTIVTIIYFFWVNPRLGTIALLGVLLNGLILRSYLNTCFNASSTADYKHNVLHEEISDTLNNIISVYASGTDFAEIERLEELQKQLDTELTNSIKCASDFKRVFGIAQLLFLGALNGYSFYLYSQKELGLDSFISVLFISSTFASYWRSVMGEIREIIHYIGIVNTSQEYLDTLVSSSKEEGFVPQDKTIVIESLRCRNLDIPELVIKEGESVAIVGQIGAGKTTLVQCILKLIDYSGNIYVGNKNIQRMNTDELRRSVSYVPQTPKLFNRSLLENIGYGNRASKDDIESVVNQLGLQLGDLDRKTGKNGSNVSGGQRQIISLLRCLLSRKAKVVILDEPTASLDSNSKKEVMKLISEIGKGRTLIVITHDGETAGVAGRLIRL